MNEPVKKPDRTLVIILCVVGALVIVALVVVFSRGEPRQLDESSPAGVVQRYSAAVLDGDEPHALGYLTAEVRDQCGRPERVSKEDLRVLLVSTTERDDTADVDVRVVTSYEGGTFGSSESEFEDTFGLLRVGGQWRIDTAPWQLTICPNAKVTG
jgi:hypothetical protein